MDAQSRIRDVTPSVALIQSLARLELAAHVPLARLLRFPHSHERRPLRGTHSLVDQSLHSRMGAETTNGDGFGLGWYDVGDRSAPGRYRSIAPAWNDANLRDLASHVESPLFLAHIRAAIGSPVQQTNCHPFRHGRWLFVHNGMIDGFPTIHRDLALAVDPSLFGAIGGSTDSETLFYLALTFGLEEDPLGGLERASDSSRPWATDHGIDHPMQGTLGLSDGERLWAVRYSSESRVRCSTPPTFPHCASATPTGKSSENSQTTRG